MNYYVIVSKRNYRKYRDGRLVGEYNKKYIIVAIMTQVLKQNSFKYFSISKQNKLELIYLYNKYCIFS